MRDINLPNRNKTYVARFTCSSLSFSLFFIQIFPCPCGSINNGYLVALVTIMPFWTDNSSFGRPCRFHSPIVGLSTNIPMMLMSLNVEVENSLEFDWLRLLWWKKHCGKIKKTIRLQNYFNLNFWKTKQNKMRDLIIIVIVEFRPPVNKPCFITNILHRFFKGVLGTRSWSLESAKIIIGSLESEKIGSLQVHTGYLKKPWSCTRLSWRLRGLTYVDPDQTSS